MKKAKVMLLTIAVFASVGAALAFKVHKVGSFDYCYLTTDTRPDVGKCTDKAHNIQVDPNGVGSSIFYTMTSDLNACSQADCPNQAFGLQQ
jgi:hypothetical protein